MATEKGMYEKSGEAAAFIRKAIGEAKVDVWIILGSGLGDFAKNIEHPITIPYEQIPHFPNIVVRRVGELVVGQLSGKRVIVQQGRWFTYEGHDAGSAVLGVRVMHHLGVKQMIATNAASGVNFDFCSGNLMLMTNHINLLGMDPLTGPNDDRFGPRFPDMPHAYNPELLDVARRSAKECGVAVVEGVYAAFQGPDCYTPSVMFARMAGADAVGCSTVPEVLAANHQGARVLGISYITRLAPGIINTPPDQKKVQEVADLAAANFTKLLITIVKNM